MEIKVPRVIKQFGQRVAIVTKSRIIYAKVTEEGGPRAAQLKDEMKTAVAGAVPALRRAFRNRNVEDVWDAVGAVWRAQGKATDAIIANQQHHEAARMQNDAFLDDLMGKANMPAEIPTEGAVAPTTEEPKPA